MEHTVQGKVMWKMELACALPRLARHKSGGKRLPRTGWRANQVRLVFRCPMREKSDAPGAIFRNLVTGNLAVLCIAELGLLL